jgi:hypothetical protein
MLTVRQTLIQQSIIGGHRADLSKLLRVGWLNRGRANGYTFLMPRGELVTLESDNGEWVLIRNGAEIGRGDDGEIIADVLIQLYKGA